MISFSRFYTLLQIFLPQFSSKVTIFLYSLRGLFYERQVSRIGHNIYILISLFSSFQNILPLPQIINIRYIVLFPMTRITTHLHKNVLSVIMDIIEMDHFREPELDEVQFFLESTGTHGSVVNETAAEMDCTSSKIQSRENVLVDFESSFSSMN